MKQDEEWISKYAPYGYDRWSQTYPLTIWDLGFIDESREKLVARIECFFSGLPYAYTVEHICGSEELGRFHAVAHLETNPISDRRLYQRHADPITRTKDLVDWGMFSEPDADSSAETGS